MDPSGVPLDILRQFDVSDSLLRQVSFEPLFYVKYVPSENLTGHIRFYVNDHEKDTVMHVHFKQRTNSGIKTFSYYEFQSGFSDNFCVDTNNYNLPRIFKRGPKTAVYNHGGIKNPVELYEKHRVHTSSASNTAYKIIPNKGDAFKYIVDSLKEEIEEQVKFGYYYWDPASRLFRVTWKGAIIYTFNVSIKVLFKPG
ncbi:hypothetical protein JW948_13970 [bacterium]|nr:hypothetical protein [bacterium]